MRISRVGTFFAVLLSLLPIQALAVTRTWDGGGANTLWSTAANWNGDTVPGAGDDALFDGTSTKSVSVNANTTIRAVAITSSYTGNITQSGGAILTVATGSFVMGGGTWRGGSGSMVINQHLTLSGGTFIAPRRNLQLLGNFLRTGGSFDANHGSGVFLSAINQTLTPGGVSFGNISINDGLAGYWKFDEASGTSVSDASRFGVTGLAGGAAVSTTVPTVSFTDTRSRSFDGNDDYVFIPSLVGQPATVTISAWIKPAAVGITGEIVSIANSFVLRLNGGDLSGFFYDGGFRFTSSYTLSDTNWHHVLYEYVGSGNQRLYVDGSLVGSSSFPGSINYTGAGGTGTYIGSHGACGCARFFNGNIDDVRIYGRALTATEIQSLSGGGQLLGSMTLGGNLSLSGSLTLDSGTLDVSASNYAVTLSGSWLNRGATFTPRSGTVTLDGTAQTLRAGGSSFSTLVLAGSGIKSLADAANVSTALSIGAGSTLALPGYDLTATSTTITNAGIISQTSGGKIVHPGSLSVSPSSLAIGNAIGITLADSDANTNGTTIDTVSVTSGGESATLTETAVASGVFTGSFSTAHGSDVASNGVIESDDACSFRATAHYADLEDASDTQEATAIVTDDSVFCEQGGGGGGGRNIAALTKAASDARENQSNDSARSSASSPASRPATPSTSKSQFSDVLPDDWFASFVAALAERGIVSGYKDAAGQPTGLFKPANLVTRAEMLKMALVAAGKEAITGEPRNLSARGTWASGYVKTAEDLKLSVITPSLDVQAPATRGELIQTILEAFDSQIITGPNPFTDIDETSPYAAAIETAARLGIVQGDTDADGHPLNRFRSSDPVNRAETAKIVVQAMTLLEHE